MSRMVAIETLAPTVSLYKPLSPPRFSVLTHPLSHLKNYYYYSPPLLLHHSHTHPYTLSLLSLSLSLQYNNTTHYNMKIQAALILTFLSMASISALPVEQEAGEWGVGRRTPRAGEWGVGRRTPRAEDAEAGEWGVGRRTPRAEDAEAGEWGVGRRTPRAEEVEASETVTN